MFHAGLSTGSGLQPQGLEIHEPHGWVLNWNGGQAIVCFLNSNCDRTQEYGCHTSPSPSTSLHPIVLPVADWSVVLAHNVDRMLVSPVGLGAAPDYPSWGDVVRGGHLIQTPAEVVDVQEKKILGTWVGHRVSPALDTWLWGAGRGFAKHKSLCMGIKGLWGHDTHSSFHETIRAHNMGP